MVFIDISGLIDSFALVLFVALEYVVLLRWVAAGPPRKSICPRLNEVKVGSVHGHEMEFMIWGCLTRPRRPFKARGSALTLNVDISHGSKNLLQRGMRYRHEKILLRQGRLQARTQERYIYKSECFHLYLRIDQFVRARALCGTRICCSAAVGCGGTAQKII